MRGVSAVFVQKYPFLQDELDILVLFISSVRSTTSTMRRTYMSTSSSLTSPAKNTTTAIKHASAMKPFTAQSRIYCTPKSLEVAMKKTGIEPRNISSSTQATPVVNRTPGRVTPQGSRYQSQPVSSRLGARNYTVSATSNRNIVSPAQPRRQTGYLSSQSSARKERPERSASMMPDRTHTTMSDRTLTSVPVERQHSGMDVKSG